MKRKYGSLRVHEVVKMKYGSLRVHELVERQYLQECYIYTRLKCSHKCGIVHIRETGDQIYDTGICNVNLHRAVT